MDSNIVALAVAGEFRVDSRDMAASPPLPAQQPEIIATITLPGGIPCTILRGHDPELARRQREFMNDLVRATGARK